MYVIPTQIISDSAPLPVTGSVPRRLPRDGAIDLCEEEMEQSVFGQESTNDQAINPLHFIQGAVRFGQMCGALLEPSFKFFGVFCCH